MRSLSQETTNYAGKVVCKGYVLVEDVENCERQIHTSLQEYRFQGSEYFNIPILEIVNTIRNTFDHLIIEDWLEDPIERYANVEYYDIPKNYTLPEMQFEELVDDLPNLDFRRAAKFIHTNCHPTWISLGVPNKDTMRVFYLLANKTNIGKCNYLKSVPSSLSAIDIMNILTELKNVEMKNFFLLANGQLEHRFPWGHGIGCGNDYINNLSNLLMIIGLVFMFHGVIVVMQQ